MTKQRKSAKIAVRASSGNLLPSPLFIWRLHDGLRGRRCHLSARGRRVGYHYLDGLPWVDSLLNASMILGGMGPVDPLKTTAGKIFASAVRALQRPRF